MDLTKDEVNILIDHWEMVGAGYSQYLADLDNIERENRALEADIVELQRSRYRSKIRKCSERMKELENYNYRDEL